MSENVTSAVSGSKGRNIVVCCDGTGNQFIDRSDLQDSNSNVVKLYATLAMHNRQVGYYHPGVGTSGDPRARNRMESFWSRVKGLAFAEGFRDNVLDAYRYLMDTYGDGDRVYLIGFSRGAYTVRALAGLLDGYGLLCPGNQGHLPYAWNDYLKQHVNRKQTAVLPNHAFKAVFSRPGFSVHFLGIWDTVSSVGWVNTPLRLWNVARAPGVEIGRHAISIDERRCFYRDNLFAEKRLEIKMQHAGPVRPETATEERQDLLQVWFPGVHSDIGGSYPQRESVLSNEALAWLIEEARRAGAELQPQMVDVVLGKPAHGHNPVQDGKICDLQDLFVRPDRLVVHRSLRRLWWLLELLPHRYYDKDEGEEVWRTPLGMRRRIPGRSYVHHTAVRMMQDLKLGYRPKNLLGGDQMLFPVEVAGQPEGTLFEYRPGADPQPILNRPVVRWTVMVVVSALDVAAVGALLGGAWRLGRTLLR